MSYNSNLPADTTAPAEIRENLRALKEDKIVDAATAVVADSAAKLTNARKISLEGDATGSTSFDGSADVSIKVDVLSADVSATCTGNAATATKLETARNINGVAFDGTKDITITATANGGNSDTVGGYTPNNLMPLGAIIMWSGSIANIPSKWALCNGSNGTPDLRNRFVVGAGGTYVVGAVGGEATHLLTASEMPSHNHSFNGSSLNIRMKNAQYEANTSGDEAFVTAYWVDGGYINTPISISGSTDSTGGAGAHNNMPPYYALAYIMRIA